MVQRKVPNKLGIQADHVKSSKQLANLIKPSSPQHHDGMKNKGGPDLSKKMKKTRPVKQSSDMESLRSPIPLRKEILQPVEPPTLRVPITATASSHKQKQSPAKLPEAVSAQKLSPGKGPEASPNYMKSTSSFDARKDRSSVSSQISQTAVVHKTPSPKNSEKSKHSPAGHKASRPSNLTLVRTLTKTPSFKPSRASKKCSPVALCEDLDVQRATCSSTLKDSKFPHYLKLNPGGTELEGTSAMKVCPYTYCSLNGHHHAPLPPLKCFLSARRRMLKTQKSFKLGCLSPRRTRLSGDSMEKTAAGLAIFAEELAIQETNLEDLSATIPSPEGNNDFFIEIYTKDGEDGSAAAMRSKHLTDEKEVATEKADGKIMESLLKESPCPETDFGNFNQNSDAISIEMNTGEFSPDYWMEEMAEETYGTGSSQEEIASPPSNLLDQPDSEAFDIECKAEERSALSIYDGLILESAEPQDDVVHEQQIFHSDGTADNCIKEVLDEEVLQGLYDEETVSSEAWLEDDSEHDVSYNMEIDDIFVLSNNLSCDRLSPASDALAVPSTTEDDGSNEPDDCQSTGSTWYSMEDTNKAPEATSEDKNEVETTNQIPIDLQLGDNVRDEMALGQVGAINSMVTIEPFDSSEGLTEADKNENHEENRLAAIIEDSEENQPDTNGGSPTQTQDDSSDSNYAVVTPHIPHKEQEEAKMFRPPNSNHCDDHEKLRMLRLSKNENNEQAVDSIEVESTSMYDGEKRCSTAESKSSTAPKNFLSCVSSPSNDEMLNTCTNIRIFKSERPGEELDDSRGFNPREPNYLPLELDPEAQKVDLKHQMIDERKNAEEWMVDFALRQAVTRLAPARKKKVALLVEAFEKVTPVPKYPTYIRQTSRAFAHTRPMQACS